MRVDTTPFVTRLSTAGDELRATLDATPYADELQESLFARLDDLARVYADVDSSFVLGSGSFSLAPQANRLTQIHRELLSAARLTSTGESGAVVGADLLPIMRIGGMIASADARAAAQILTARNPQKSIEAAEGIEAAVAAVRGSLDDGASGELAHASLIDAVASLDAQLGAASRWLRTHPGMTGPVSSTQGRLVHTFEQFLGAARATSTGEHGATLGSDRAAPPHGCPHGRQRGRNRRECREERSDVLLNRQHARPNGRKLATRP